jgi:hypothetical protein
VGLIPVDARAAEALGPMLRFIKYYWRKISAKKLLVYAKVIITLVFPKIAFFSSENRLKMVICNIDDWGRFFVHHYPRNFRWNFLGNWFFETFSAKNSNFPRHFRGKISEEFSPEKNIRKIGPWSGAQFYVVMIK